MIFFPVFLGENRRTVEHRTAESRRNRQETGARWAAFDILRFVIRQSAVLSLGPCPNRRKQELSRRRRQEEVVFIVTDGERTRLPIEVKFGTRVRPEELWPLLGLMERQKIRRGLVVTRNKVDKLTIDGRQVDLLPFYLL